ncbi:MAG: hypothetical protein H6568_11865 [Lewinellaceae bacterium]|nr:hypothetical protein [Saprospiraceae bacterium]MCB9313450.1 hypothetical protein [Lewinellaceae bacterium]HRW75242.1 hypothetical protein [Saprospiraceae bacterium]
MKGYQEASAVDLKMHHHMKNLLVIAGICLVGVHGFAQGLTLSRGHETKTFKENTIFEMVLSNEYPYSGGQLCEYQEVVGSVVSARTDSLFMQLYSLVDHRNHDDARVTQLLLNQSPIGTYPVSVDRIVRLESYKSMKNKKAHRNLAIAGGLLMFTGAATALNAILMKGQSNKRTLLLSGGLQFGLGIGFAVASRPNRYYLHHRPDPWVISPR